VTPDQPPSRPDWEALIARAHDPLLLDPALRVVACGPHGLASLGVGRNALVGKSLLEVISRHGAAVLPREFVAAMATHLERVRATGEAQVAGVFEVPVVDPQHGHDGYTHGLVRVLSLPLFGPDSELQFIVQCIEDVTQLEAALRPSSHAQLRSERELHEAHAALEKRVQERTIELERANQEVIDAIAEQLKTEQALQRSQEQLHHAQRLEAVGRLAGGIAHDFNNLLSVVLGYSITLAAALPEGSTMRADIDEIRRAGERAAELTQQLLAFGRQQVLEPKVVDLNEVMLRVERMIRRILGEDIELITVPRTGLWKVKVDPGQIEQVIMNLVINARDAMASGGSLTLETANVEFDDDYTQAHVGASAGPHVVLAVSDTGMGMDKNTQARAFEPFFTTKEKGRGTGLGLSTVFGIVRQSGGHIWLYSELGKGTTFKVCFPRTVDTDQRAQVPLTADGVSMPCGHETILLVEDDTQLRELARKILVRQGYQVLDAPNAAEAMTMSARFSGHIALLVTDVVMPQMSGRELARQFAKSRPETKVLYISGYTDNAIVHNGVLDAGVEFLQKPLRPELFARKVRQVLDATDETE
jgi:signal transduction histidine kinase/ActR/RegA family two-component response regulator